MKKKPLIVASAIVILAILLILSMKPWVNKPFKNLSAKEIDSVSVALLPPDESFNLSDEEIIEFVSILNSVVIYNQDSSYDQYDGQAVVYTVTKTNGANFTVNAYNPFLIIDDVGYKTKYEPCEDLNALGNRIRNNK